MSHAECATAHLGYSELRKPWNEDCPRGRYSDGVPNRKVVLRGISHAATVFEEAARLSYQLRQLWPQASALTPKIPAQSALSHADAQTHRLQIQQMSSTCPVI